MELPSEVVTEDSILERLVETIVARAEAEAARVDPSARVETIDRRALLAKAGGAEDPEDGVGRVVLAAEQAANQLLENARSRPGRTGIWATGHGAAAGTTMVERPIPPAPVANGRVGLGSAGRYPVADYDQVDGAPRLPPVPVSIARSDEPMRPAARDVPLARPDEWRSHEHPSPLVAGEMDPPSTQSAEDGSGRRAIAIATWVRNLGAILLVFVAYQLWGTALEQHRSQHQLKSQFAASLHASATAASSGSPSPPALGAAVARLQVAKLGIDEYVVEGIGASDLKKGPGHYAGTPLPGQRGDAAIAGHRTTYGAPFNRLDELAPGDVILTTTAAGASQYQVSEKPKSVSPGDTQVVSNLGDDRLTLTTCTPKYSAARRLVVVAKLVQAGAGTGNGTGPATSQPTVTPARRPVTVNTGDLAWHWDQLFPCLVMAGGLIALTKVRARVRGVFGPSWWLVVVIPVWASGLLLLFEALGRLLPANV